MKKSKLALFLALVALNLVVLSGCSCEHEWLDASCEEPAKCSLCEEVKGEALGHTWADATCETPNTCSVCGTTDGEALGHTWVDATYDSPKSCTTCGKTEGEALPVIQAVEQAYEEALAFARENKKDQNYAYILLHDEMFSLLADASIDKYDEESVEKIFGEVDSKDEAIQLLTKTLSYVVSDGDDYLSALMRKFSAAKSVTGTISTTSVDIEVVDVAELLDELHIKPDVLGRILAMLDIYDYTWLSDSSEPLLQFTEHGFAYHWESLTQYILDLQYQGAPLSAQDFIIRIVDEDSEDMDAIEYFKNSGWSDGILAIFDDKNMDEDDEDFYTQILTDRGIYVGSTLDMVLMTYGSAEIHDIEKEGIPNSNTLQKNLDTDAYMAKLFERQCSTYVMYSYQNTYDICICFDSDRTVSWVIYFYNAK